MAERTNFNDKAPSAPDVAAGRLSVSFAPPPPDTMTVHEPAMTESPTVTGASPQFPLWKKLLFSSLLLLTMGGALEIGSYAYLRATRGYAGGDFLQYQFDPYQNIRLTPNWQDTRGVLTHNAQGFRRRGDVSREKPTGTFRVFLMGGSTAYGLGGLFPHIQTEFDVLDDSETIDAYLEEILERELDYDDVEVINAAIPSIWTHHHLINLNQVILGYDPDMILFLDGWNDHYFYDRSHDQFSSYAQREQAEEIMGPPTLSALVRMNGWWLFRKSAFVHVAIRAARDAKAALTGGGPRNRIDVERALVDLQWVFERNALKMVERNALILQHEGIPAIVMLQPILLLDRDRAMPAVERELFEFMAGWIENNEEFLRRATPLIADRLRETVTPLGARFIDMTSVYDGVEGQMFTDYVHLTPDGNRVLAERVALEILSMVGDSSSDPR